jgi:hypothetical protein
MLYPVHFEFYFLFLLSIHSYPVSSSLCSCFSSDFHPSPLS